MSVSPRDSHNPSFSTAPWAYAESVLAVQHSGSLVMDLAIRS